MKHKRFSTFQFTLVERNIYKIKSSSPFSSKYHNAIIIAKYEDAIVYKWKIVNGDEWELVLLFVKTFI